MGLIPSNSRKTTLPLSDLVIFLLYSVIIPILLLIPLMLFLSFVSFDVEGFLILTIPIGFIFLILIYFYFVFRNRIKDLAIRVSFYHFQPTSYEFVIHLTRYVYYILFFSIFLNFILERLDAEYLSLVVFIILAVVFSLAIQFFTVIMTYKMKRNLVITARESVDNEIITKLHSYEPKSDLIKEYRFADIEVQTLFLSAGVTSFGYSNNICLVSRYFQWKLSEEELLSVL
ncbi:MAG: hypothetical protein ACXABI_17345, partial [Candidatus Hodarchaeales archaeon]